MSNGRLVFQNWIVDMKIVPGQIKNLFRSLEVDSEPDNEIDTEVRRAIESLDEEEMEFVIRFYFMGQSYHEISEKSGRQNYKLEALHKRAIRKLKSRLRKFVKNKYGVKSAISRPCPLCQSPHRAGINEIIVNRNENSTWRPVMEEINKQFGIKIKSPQVLIGHLKYHLERN